MERTQHIYRRRKKEESDKMTGDQLLINIMAWFVIHMFIAYRCTKISPFYLKKDLALFKVQSWETVGIYKKFGVHRWKPWLPDGGKLFKRGFYKKKWESRTKEYAQLFLVETNRAELTHWISILPSILFFIWNSPSIGVWMVIYAIVANVPFILVQRYNRIRIHQVVLKLKRN
ncbi:glycosyl-4,4'-diaponeurosporenoate acyltransferase [Priestia megaterium]|uniref:glycosyl-4,4'-diaponeurosporenoate acyltransferase CrtO family protein n=1 Tax=Priestia megaterium TaxID=1404 RepID=UPI002E2327A4|nr:glycosyl-4,4'-diaponeurosporenoate acyltransferase [Priestia megaterium]